MTLAFKVNRITISGTAFNGEEIWSTGFYMGHETADALPPTQAGVAAIGSAWQTFWTTAANKVSNQYVTYQIKMATINTNGSTDQDSVVYHDYLPLIVGPAATSPYPPQIALVATLMTTTPRGLGSKGRMYLAGHTNGLDANGKVSAADRTALANNLGTFFTSLNQHADLFGNWVTTASNGREAPPTVGVNRPVTAVRIGSVLDTQRRRRNALVESYTSAAVGA